MPRKNLNLIKKIVKGSKGLIDVHQIDNKYLLKFPDSSLGSKMMTITRYSKKTGGSILWRRNQQTGRVKRFE
jgi:hypothetical protein